MTPSHITAAVNHVGIPFDLTLGSIEVSLRVSHAQGSIKFDVYSQQGQLLGTEIRTVGDICAALAGRLPGMASKPPGGTV